MPQFEDNSERNLDLRSPFEFNFNYSLPSNDLSLDAQLKFIDSLVSNLHIQISRLKIHRNTLVPIFQLPDDILSKIFFEYASTSNFLFNLKWTKLMLVCRRWAHIGIYTKSLWSSIDMEGHQYDRTESQLERSGLAPLSIKTYLLENDDIFVTHVIKDHAERIQVLDLSGHGQAVKSFLASLSQWRLPALRSIQVKPSQMGEQLLHFPESILDGRAPFLHSLFLDGCSVRWDLLHDLTHLSITHQSRINSSVTIPSLDVLLSALERSPSLKTLKLQRFIAPEPGVHSMVNLPQLELLELSDNVERCANLLHSIIIPATASISLYPTGISYAFVARDLLIPVRRHFRSKSAHTFRLLTISCTKEYLNIKAYTNTEPVDYFDDKAYFHINAHPFAELDRRKIITKVLHAIPLDTITHLETRFYPLLTETSWKTVYSLLTSLHTLIIGVQTATVNIATALTQMIATPRRGAPFPRIKTINLHGVFFDFNGKSADVPGRVSAALVELLTQYKTAGAPVEHLEVTKNNGFLRDSTLHEIYDLVGKITFDGKVYDPLEIARRTAKYERILREATSALDDENDSANEGEGEGDSEGEGEDESS